MVRLDARIDNVGEFTYSNMIDTNNSSIKNHAYRLINVLHKANVDFLKIYACLDWNLAWLD